MAALDEQIVKDFTIYPKPVHFLPPVDVIWSRRGDKEAEFAIWICKELYISVDISKGGRTPRYDRRRYRMDFTNFVAVEFVSAIEAQRDHERKQRKWLLKWHDLRRAAAASARSAPTTVSDVAQAA
jgi:hypothetical protein